MHVSFIKCVCVTTTASHLEYIKAPIGWLNWSFPFPFRRYRSDINGRLSRLSVLISNTIFWWIFSDDSRGLMPSREFSRFILKYCNIYFAKDIFIGVKKKSSNTLFVKIKHVFQYTLIYSESSLGNGNRLDGVSYVRVREILNEYILKVKDYKYVPHWELAWNSFVSDVQMIRASHLVGSRPDETIRWALSGGLK